MFAHLRLLGRLAPAAVASCHVSRASQCGGSGMAEITPEKTRKRSVGGSLKNALTKMVSKSPTEKLGYSPSHKAAVQVLETRWKRYVEENSLSIDKNTGPTVEECKGFVTSWLTEHHHSRRRQEDEEGMKRNTAKSNLCCIRTTLWPRLWPAVFQHRTLRADDSARDSAGRYQACKKDVRTDAYWSEISF